MKPFDKERALAGDPVVTRDGRKVSELHLFSADEAGYPLVAVIGGKVILFTADGVLNLGCESHLDLFMAPVKKTYWVNVYRTSNACLFTSYLFESENDACHNISGDAECIGTYPIEIEE